MLKNTSISYTSIPFFQPIHAYLSLQKNIAAFYSYAPTLEGLQKKIHTEEKQVTNRELLYNVIKKQYTSIQRPHQQTLQAIEKLALDTTFTVTTGHQLCLLGGSAFFMYKAISVIQLAQQLTTTNKDKNIIPIFWLATEDHDIPEIATITIANQKYTWNTSQEGITGTLSLNDEAYNNWLQEVETQLQTLFPTLNYPIRDFLKQYSQHKNLADATRWLLHEWFGEYGLLVLDANDPSLKESFQAILQKELKDNVIYDKVSTTNKELHKVNPADYVNPRHPALFYIDENNQRHRIEKNNGKYYLIHATNYQLIENIQSLKTKQLSPNVLFRPLYQEYILPNLAYIGGSSEVKYWLQLKDTFTAFGIDYPVLLVRNSFLFTNNKIQALEYKLKTTSETILQNSFAALEKKLLRELFEIPEDLITEATNDFVNQLLEHPTREHNNPSLNYALESLKKRIEKQLIQYEYKLYKSHKQKNKQLSIDLSKIYENYYPTGVLQERIYSCIELYFEHGKDGIKQLLHHTSALDNKMYIMGK